MCERDDAPLAIPVVEEIATVTKVGVTSDAVHVSTRVETRHAAVEDVVERGMLRVERFAVDRAVDAAPPVRDDGPTTIISIVEERLVVAKRLFVIEEIHVTRERTQERVAVPVTLHATRATVERPFIDPAGNIIHG